MPASKEMTAKNIRKLGIIAGGGDLPLTLVRSCHAQRIETFVVCFDGHTDEGLLGISAGKKAKLGQVGKIIKSFQSQGIKDLVMIGSIKRPSFSELVPDLKAAQFLTKNGAKVMGDSDLLSALKAFLEDEGFTLHGVQDFVPDLLMPEGCLTKTEPSKSDWVDIHHGINLLKQTASLDVGQAVIVQDGLVLGVEAIEGTAALIERCGTLRRKGRKGALVKLCKPQQDTALDLPTIGLKTVEAMHKAGFGGIVAHAGKSLLSNQEELVSYANKHHLYVVGVNPEEA